MTSPDPMWATLRKRIWEWRSVWITAPSVAGVIILLRLAGLLQYWEWLALDQFFILRPLEPVDSRVVIVGISDQDIKNLGRWPVEDTRLAELLERIKQQKPRAIGLDLYRDFPVEPGYQKLVKVFETTPNLIGIERKGGGAGDIPIAPPPVLAKRGQVSSNDILPDGDGKIRRGFLFWTNQEDNTAIAGLGLSLALIYLQAEGIQPKPAANNPDYLQLGRAVFPIFESNDGSYIRADAAGYQILLNFRGPSGSLPTVSMTDVMTGKIPSDFLRDRIVLVGPVAESLKDLFLTPYSSASLTSPDKTAGVEIQATIASQIVSAALDGRHAIQVWADPLEYGWIILWSLIGAILGWWVRSLRWAITGMVALEGSLLVGCYLAFLGGWWIPVVPPALALAISAIVLTGYIANQEREDRQIIMNLFGRHVNPEIAEAIWRDRHQLLTAGRLVGRKMIATVLFTDLKDFSGITERTDPEILMSWLNEYMEAMSQIVLADGGIVDKFIGDSIMAVFGVPIARASPEEFAEDALKAVRCAVKMAETLDALNHKWQNQGRPTTSMRVGISTGMVVTGSLGGQQRFGLHHHWRQR
ncbi:CHASE2 domain-containing protein [Kovacikia minuta]|uniref:CHASE2 domain-containing protein n=1 Tax=Kovacikia minuta TaxID=2931930 RepID=UPI0020C7DFAB|nr:adenylate/guanylate cyclase domain-containing protein [Kovacikia minuta]